MIIFQWLTKPHMQWTGIDIICQMVEFLILLGIGAAIFSFMSGECK